MRIFWGNVVTVFVLFYYGERKRNQKKSPFVSLAFLKHR